MAADHSVNAAGNLIPTLKKTLEGVFFSVGIYM